MSRSSPARPVALLPVTLLPAALLPAALALALWAGPALADPSLPPPAAMALPAGDLVVDLGVAARLMPRYPGADETALRVRPLFGLERLKLPGVGVVGSGPAEGVILYPSVQFQGERNASDQADLTGMRDLDWTLGVGLGAGVNRKSWRAFAEVRAGVKGYSGLTARAGADLLWAPSPQTVLAVGPRIDLVGQDYARTWFGVTPAEAAASGGKLAAFAPDGGLASAGLAASWGWALSTGPCSRSRPAGTGGWGRSPTAPLSGRAPATPSLSRRA